MIFQDLHGSCFWHMKMMFLKAFTTFYKKVQNEKGYIITSIRSDHGGEFDNDTLESFCNECGFEHNFWLLEHHNKMVH